MVSVFALVSLCSGLINKRGYRSQAHCRSGMTIAIGLVRIRRVVELETASPTNTYAMFWTALLRYKTALLLSCNNKCNVSKYNSLYVE